MSGGVLNSRPELCNKNMPFISTSYDYDALIDEQPIWGHLKDLHMAIKLCEEALIATEITSPGPNLELRKLFQVLITISGLSLTGTVCSAFLANTSTSDATVTFNGNSYHLPGWFVSILPDCKNVVLNIAKINYASMISSFTTESLEEEVDSLDGSSSGWSWISEPGLLEQ
ncbi:beta-galactosidase [Trifolium repens]|nr:beta-galactosidase [Trifolium repens]